MTDAQKNSVNDFTMTKVALFDENAMPLSIEIEIYRGMEYKQLLYDFEKMLNDANIIFIEDDPRHNFNIIAEIMSGYVYAQTDNTDPLLTPTPNFTLEIIEPYIKKKWKTVDSAKIMPILDSLSKKMVTSYRNLKEYITTYNPTIRKYKPYLIGGKTVTLGLSGNDEHLDKGKRNFNISSNQLKRLHLIYSERNKSSKFGNFLEKLYILYYRYYTFTSGSVQASILPVVKNILKQKLNIDVELFGSSLNTNTSQYGTHFYDIERYFGSIGSYFDLEIRSGYYELNPPFDVITVRKIFKMIYETLKSSTKALLYVMIIPSYDQYMGIFEYYQKLVEEGYVKKIINFERKDFPYEYLDPALNEMIIRPIVKTSIFVLCNDKIPDNIQQNIITLEEEIVNAIKTVNYRTINISTLKMGKQTYKNQQDNPKSETYDARTIKSVAPSEEERDNDEGENEEIGESDLSDLGME